MDPSGRPISWLSVAGRDRCTGWHQPPGSYVFIAPLLTFPSCPVPSSAHSLLSPHLPRWTQSSTPGWPRRTGPCTDVGQSPLTCVLFLPSAPSPAEPRTAASLRPGRARSSLRQQRCGSPPPERLSSSAASSGRLPAKSPQAEPPPVPTGASAGVSASNRTGWETGTRAPGHRAGPWVRSHHRAKHSHPGLLDRTGRGFREAGEPWAAWDRVGQGGCQCRTGHLESWIRSSFIGGPFSAKAQRAGVMASAGQCQPPGFPG